MEIQLPLWVYIVSLLLWAFAGYVWGRAHAAYLANKRLRRDSPTITVSDASQLYEGQIIVAVNPSTCEQSAPMTVTKIGKGKS